MKKLFITILLIFITISFAAAQDLTMMTEENAPFNFSSGDTVKGIGADLLVSMLQLSGRTEKAGDIRILPWARSYNEVQNKPGTMLFSMGRTEARENLFKWVGPIYHLQIGLIAKKSTKINISGIDDLKNYTTGTVRDGAPEQLVLGAGADESSLDRSTSLSSNLKKLMAGRIDLVAFNVPAALYNLKTLGADLSEYELVYVLKDLDLYYAFHSSTDDALIKSLQASLDTLKNNGEYDRTVSKYLN